jgi:hypothetical protein
VQRPGSDKTELIRQLGVRRVISLLGDEGGDTIQEVFQAIEDNQEFEALNFKQSEIDALNFEFCKWTKIVSRTSLEVNSSDSLEDFYQYCLADDDKLRFENAQSFFAGVSTALCEDRGLCVIEGLQSKEHWDLIRDAFVPEDTKSCTVIITNKEAVARHCKDYSWRKMDAEELAKANKSAAAIIDPLLAQKVCIYFALLLIWQSSVVVLVVRGGARI